jgi:FAD/FMN-containing dehydrogenase
VIGSMLEREPILRPGHHWDSTDPLLCMEVVFGTGDRFRTGEASGPDTVEEQWEMGRVQMNPFGHSHVDFQRLISGAQGTIGLVTWATLKCSPLPTAAKAFFMPSLRLEPLLDLTYRFTRFRFSGSLFILNSLNLACLLGRDAPEIENLKTKFPPWVLFVTFEGHGMFPEEKVAYEEDDFAAMAGQRGLKPEAIITGAHAGDLSRLLSHPSDPYWKAAYKGRFHDIFFLTTLDKVPVFTGAIPDLAEKYGFQAADLGVYIQPVVQGTSCHCEFNLYYNPGKSQEAEAARRMVSACSEDIARMGGFFSRPYPSWKETAYRRAAGTMIVQRKIKQIFDPKEILNPGKLCF